MCVYLPVFWCVWVCGEEGRGWEGVSIERERLVVQLHFIKITVSMQAIPRIVRIVECCHTETYKNNQIFKR